MADGFLSRWSRLKAEAREAPPADASITVQPEAGPANPVATAAPISGQVRASVDAASDVAAPNAQPTLEDVMRLGPDSDYAAFVARGVDASVRRQALRKLFTDPHFNIVDGLDVYMGDYNKADPIAPAMLASLQHAGAWLRAQLDSEGDDPAAAGHAQDAAAALAQQDHLPDSRPANRLDQRQDHLPDHIQATAPQGAPAREHDEY